MVAPSPGTAGAGFLPPHRHRKPARQAVQAAPGQAGPLTIGFYTTGQLVLEEYYTLGLIGLAGIGTPHMDGNTRLCTATAGQALKESARIRGRSTAERPSDLWWS
jgi:hypothetical protein